MIKTTQHLPKNPQVRDIVYYSNYKALPICEHQRELECFGDVGRGMNIVAAKVDFQTKVREATGVGQDQTIEATFILEKDKVLVKAITSTQFKTIDINQFDAEVVESIHDVLLRANQAWKVCPRCKEEADARTLLGRVRQLEDELAQEKAHSQDTLQIVRDQEDALCRLSEKSSNQAQQFSQATQHFKRDLETRDAEIRKLHIDLEREQAELREVKQDRDKALQQNEQDRKRLDELEKSVRDKESTIADLQRRNESLQSENARLIESHKRALENLKSEHERILEIQTRLLNQAREELRVAKQQIETMAQERLEQIQEMQTKHASSLLVQQGQIDNLHGALEEKTVELQGAQERLACDKANHANLVEKMGILESSIQNIEVYIDSLKRQHEEAQRKLLDSLEEILGEMKEEVSKAEGMPEITEEQLRIRQAKEAKLKDLPLPDQITQLFAELKTNFSILKAKMKIQDARIDEQSEIIADLMKPPMEQFELEEKEKSFSLLGYLRGNTGAPESSPKDSIVARQQAQIRRNEILIQRLEQNLSHEHLVHQRALLDLEDELRESREKFKLLQMQIIDTQLKVFQDEMENIGLTKPQINQFESPIGGIKKAFTDAAEFIKKREGTERKVY